MKLLGNKSIIVIRNRKFFCDNDKCKKITFSEKYNFFKDKAQKTKRLEDEIVNISKNVSSITASKLIRKNIACVGKSTICNILKKRNTNS